MVCRFFLLFCIFLGSVHAAKRKALILSSVTYHMEVSMFFAWQLHELGIEVTFVTRAGPLFSFSRASTISSVVKTTKYLSVGMLPHPSLSGGKALDMAVLITSDKDIAFFESSGKVAELKKSLGRNPLLLVQHHGEAVAMQPVTRFCEKHSFNCHVLFLSQHTHDHALEDMKRVQMNTAEMKFAYVYPVFDLKKLFGIDKDNKPYLDVPNAPLRLALQGKVHDSRRNYSGMLKFLEGYSNNSAWHLDIVGENAKKLKLSPALARHVALYDEVEYDKFYEIIHGADVLVCAFNDLNGYDTIRASSSIPAAIMAGTALLLPAKFLRHYQCLQRGRVHSQWGNNATSSDAMLDQLVTHHSRGDIHHAHRESIVCYNEWSQHNSATVRSIIAAANGVKK